MEFQYPAKPKKAQFVVNCVLGFVDGEYHSMSFGVVSKGGAVVPCAIRETDWGIEHNYKGDDKDALEDVLAGLAQSITDKYGKTWAEKPAVPEMPEHPQEPTEE